MIQITVANRQSYRDGGRDGIYEMAMEYTMMLWVRVKDRTMNENKIAVINSLLPRPF